MARKRANESDNDGGAAAIVRTRQKRARKEFANDKCPLLNLPGELRNRIYEFAIAKASPLELSSSILLNYRSIKGLKRFKTQKRWTSAHSHREYWGLVQVCRMFRQEFRLLYQKDLPIRIRTQHIVQYLCVFGMTQEDRIFGQSIKDIVEKPLPDAGLDILPMLKKLSREKASMPILLGPYKNWKASWDIGKIFTMLCHHWVWPTERLKSCKRIFANLVFVNDPSLDRVDPIVVIKLHLYESCPQKELEKMMISLIHRTGLGCFHCLSIKFRHAGKIMVWQTATVSESKRCKP